MGRSKNKLSKFAEMMDFPNVVQNFDFLKPGLVGSGGQKVDYKGSWSKEFFKNENPLILELACGRGEYTVALAAAFPDKNYMGVDIKGARIWVGARMAIEQGLANAGFLRTRIEQIGLFMGEGEVDEIWITFPDPFLLKERNRLTHHRFLDSYLPFLKPGGLIHLKTDDDTLYEFSVESFASLGQGEIIYHNADIYGGPLYDPVLEYKTYYERLNMGRGKTIKYIKYRVS